MRKLCVAAVTLAVGFQLAGCGQKAPTGQVAAKVGGDEITVQEIQAELNGYNPPDAKSRKSAEQQALQNIVERKLLAKAAAQAGVDKSPDFAIQKARVEDALLVRTWEGKLASAVPDPAPEQVRQFISQHPELFAQRRVLTVNQLRMPGTNDPKLLAELKPLNTLEDIGRVLQAHGIKYDTGKGTIDTLSLPPAVVAQIDKMSPNDVFVLPAGNTLIANKITDAKVDPVPDDVANKLAARYIKAQQAQQTVSRMFGSVMANHPKIKVVYNKAYAPPPSKAGQGPAGVKAG